MDRDLQDSRGGHFGRALDAMRDRAREQGMDKMTLDEINAVMRDLREERRRKTGG